MSLFNFPFTRAQDANGNPMAGAKLYFYYTGTLVLADVYTTEDLDVAHANPVVADAGGLFAPIYLDPEVTYRVILKTSAGVTVQDIDPYGGLGGGLATIGLFVDADTVQVRADMVYTIGFSTAGKGAARYVYDEDVDAAYVIANPLTSFLSVNSRGFRLSEDQTITPFMFGAAGIPDFAYADNDNNFSAYPDDRTALQAFYDYCDSRRVQANHSGAFAISSTVNIGGATLQVPYIGDRTMVFDGDLWLAARGAMGTMLTINARRQTHFGGQICVIGTGGFDYNDRTCDVGIDIQGYAQLMHFTGIFALGFRYAGVLLNQRTTENIFGNDFGSSFFIACGSGAPTSSNRVTTSGTGGSSTGSANTYAQYTTVTPATMPPTWLDNYLTPSVMDIGFYVRIEAVGYSQLHFVQSIQRGSGTIRVFPWLPATYAALPLTLTWYWGGGVVAFGGDAGLQNFTHLGATLCGIGYNVFALYPATSLNQTHQNNGIGISVGVPGASVIGGKNLSTYFEGGQDYDYVFSTPFSRNAGYFDLGTIQGDAQLVDIINIQPRETSSGSGTYAPSVQLGFGITLEHMGRRLEQRHIYVGGAIGCYFDMPTQHQTTYNDDPVVYVCRNADSDAALSLFGFEAQYVDVVGSGLGGAPTTVTVRKAPEATRTVQFNGGANDADLVLSGFSEAARLLIQKDRTDTENFRVTVLSKREAFSGTIIAFADHANTTVTLLQADLGSYSVVKSGGADGTMDTAAKALMAAAGDYKIDLVYDSNFGEGAFGVRVSPGGTTYSNHLLGFYWTASGVLYKNVSGTISTAPGGVLSTLSLGDRLSMQRRSGTVTGKLNGEVVFTHTEASTVGVEVILAKASAKVFVTAKKA